MNNFMYVVTKRRLSFHHHMPWPGVADAQARLSWNSLQKQSSGWRLKVLPQLIAFCTQTPIAIDGAIGFSVAALSVEVGTLAAIDQAAAYQ